MDKGIIATIPCQNKERLGVGVDAACKGSVWLFIIGFRVCKTRSMRARWLGVLYKIARRGQTERKIGFVFVLFLRKI